MITYSVYRLKCPDGATVEWRIGEDHATINKAYKVLERWFMGVCCVDGEKPCQCAFEIREDNAI